VVTAVLVQLERQDGHPELGRPIPYVTQRLSTTHGPIRAPRSDMLLAAIYRASTGTLEASNTRMPGGVVPFGIWLITVCETAVTCACAAAMLVPGWK